MHRTLLAILSALSSIIEASSIQKYLFRPTEPSVLAFELRHFHTLAPDGKTIVFQDVPPVTSLQSRPQYRIRVKPTKRHKPSSQAAFHESRRMSMRSISRWVDWEEDEIPGPDVSSNDTLGALARMTYNAYIEPKDSEWYDLGGTFNATYPIGWKSDSDGFRGHVFATPDNRTVVLSIKGTSAGMFGSGGPTQKKDKLNDNLLWSCCCARVDWSWTPVCDCYAGVGKCDARCLERTLVEESLYYSVGINLYNDLVSMYPNSNIWVAGHSLGGTLASLIGVTFGAPVVAFESPGEKLAARRLHLPSPPSTQHVTHVYHNADPIPLGACTGTLSTCYIGGYAIESHCHLGKSIIYDTVGELRWSVDIRTHGIAVVIDKVLTMSSDVPKPAPEDDCIDCFTWEFGDFLNNTRSTVRRPH